MRQYLWKHFGVELIDDFINGIGLDWHKVFYLGCTPKVRFLYYRYSLTHLSSTEYLLLKLKEQCFNSLNTSFIIATQINRS